MGLFEVVLPLTDRCIGDPALTDCAVLNTTSAYRAPATDPAGLPGPVRIPLLGQLPQFVRNPPHLVLQHLAQRHGSVFQYSLGTQRNVCIAEPELIKAILKARPHCFRRSIALANAIEGTGFQGVFTAEAERWQRQRRQVMRGLRPQVVHAAQAHISAVEERINGYFERNNGYWDLSLELRRNPPGVSLAENESQSIF